MLTDRLFKNHVEYGCPGKHSVPHYSIDRKTVLAHVASRLRGITVWFFFRKTSLEAFHNYVIKYKIQPRFDDQVTRSKITIARMSCPIFAYGEYKHFRKIKLGHRLTEKSVTN